MVRLMPHTPTDLELVMQAQRGSEQARNDLILRHFGLVHTCVRRACQIMNRPGDPNEMISHGVEAMVRAIGLFDPSHGVKLMTYAGRAIESHVCRAIGKDAPISRPQNLPISDENKHAWQRAGRAPVDVHAPELRHLHPETPSDAGESIEREERRRLVRWALEQLDERERNVILMRNVEGMTLAEVGSVLGVGKERVRQIEAKAMERIRDLVNA